MYETDNTYITKDCSLAGLKKCIIDKDKAVSACKVSDGVMVPKQNEELQSNTHHCHSDTYKNAINVNVKNDKEIVHNKNKTDSVIDRGLKKSLYIKKKQKKRLYLIKIIYTKRIIIL